MNKRINVLESGIDFIVKTSPKVLDKYGLCFLTDISVVSSKIIGQRAYRSPMAVSRKDYEPLRISAYEDIREKLNLGKFRRSETTSRLPIRTFSHLTILDENASLAKNKEGFFPTLVLGVGGRGYVRKQELIGVFSKERDGRLYNPSKKITDQIFCEDTLAIENSLDDFYDEEVERMIQDSEREYQEFVSSTCILRGEHPSSKFLAREEGYEL